MAWGYETNIRGPQGVKGDKGDQGDQGAQGPAGPPGGSAGGENVGTGQDVYKGLNGVSGALQFNRVRGTGIVTASSDASGVIVNAPTPDWAAITGKPATFPPTLPITEADVTNLVSDLALKAPLASPTFTGDPKAPTPTPGDADTSIATTAFVGTAITNAAVPPPATVAPLMDGTAAVGTTTKYAREDHKHPVDTSREPTLAAGTTAQYYRGDKSWQTLNATAVGLGNVINTAQVTSVTGTAPVVSSGGTTPAISMAAAATSVNGYLTSTDWNTFNGKAPLASPTFTGTPAAPTATAGTNTTQLASTAFVTAAVAAGGGGGASVTISDTAPGSPAAGDMWWESDSGALFVYYTDATPTSQWVQIASATSEAGGLGTAAYRNLHVGTTAPSSPAVNDVWIDTT